jgi:hypothetical protein
MNPPRVTIKTLSFAQKSRKKIGSHFREMRRLYSAASLGGAFSLELNNRAVKPGDLFAQIFADPNKPRCDIGAQTIHFGSQLGDIILRRDVPAHISDFRAHVAQHLEHQAFGFGTHASILAECLAPSQQRCPRQRMVARQFGRRPPWRAA